MKTFLFLGVALQPWSIALAQTAPFPTPAPASVPSNSLPSNSPPVDYAGAVWTPAAEGNFNPQTRPQSGPIDRVVIHDIEGPAAAGIDIFQKIGASVSAHYIVSGDGRVWQMVREHNVAWHAGNRDINHRSVGIEIEGYAYRPGWYGATTYETAAKLVRDITTRYGIPRDRTHNIGHAEVPNPRDPTRFGGVSGHTDPGPFWNWAAFMTLVRNDARLVEARVPTTIRPGETLPVSVTLTNTGDDPWPVNTARNPKIALQASGPLVVLGTENGRPSQLFNRQGWISPMAAAAATVDGAPADTLPGTAGRFEFTLRGPRELGAWSEQLRLTTMPTASQGGSPVFFGDKVTVATRVVPWVIDVSSANANVNAQEKSSTLGTPIARWCVALPLGGIYAVYAAPPKPTKTRRQRHFRYQFNTLDGAKTVLARPQDGGKGWLLAGYFRFAEPLKNGPTTAKNGPTTAKNGPTTAKNGPTTAKNGPTTAVELHSAPAGVDAKNAGAIRFIGPFPAATTGPSQTPARTDEPFEKEF